MMKRLLLTHIIVLSLMTGLVSAEYLSPSVERYCEDDTCNLILRGGPVAYDDGTGLVPIDNTITSYNKDGYDYSMTKAGYQAYFKDNSNWGDAVKYCVEGQCLIYQPQDMSYRDLYGSQDYLSNVQNVPASLHTESWSYDSIYTGVDLYFDLNADNMKERYIISTLPRDPEAYLIEPVTLDFGGYIKYGSLNLYVDNKLVTGNSFTTKNKIEFRNSTGKTLFYLPAPYAYDANGNENHNVTYEVKIQGQQIWFYVRTPTDWLKNAILPITIDPSVQLQTPDTEILDDAYIKEDHKDTNDGADYYLYNIDHSSGYDRSSLIKFNTARIHGNVTSSELCFYVVMNLLDDGTEGYNISSNEITGSWDEETVTWNLMPAFNSTPTDDHLFDGDTNKHSNSYVCWNVTNIVDKDVKNYLVGYTDFMMIAHNYFGTPTPNDFVNYVSKESTSSYRPYLNITYNIINNAPIISAKNTAPDLAYTTDDLTFNSTCTDINAWDTITGYVQLYNGSTPYGSVQSTTVSNGTNTLLYTLTSSNTAKTESWTGEYWCGDGTVNTSKTNDTVTIQNTAPSISTITINPATAHTNDTLSITNTSNDADSDTLTYDIKWYKDGSHQASLDNQTMVSNTLTNKAEEWTASIRAHDGTAWSSWTNSTEMTIQNTAPTVDTVTISPENPTYEDSLSLANSSTDADADPLTYDIKWYHNGTHNATLDNQTTITSGNLTYNHNWTASIRAHDGTSWSSWTNSSQATIGDNISPNLSDDSLSRTSGTEETPFSINVTATEAERASGIQTVKVEILSPKDIYYNFTMSHIRGSVYQYNFTPGYSGVHTFKFYATDAAGNNATLDSTLEYTYTDITGGGGGGGGGGGYVISAPQCNLRVYPTSSIQIVACPAGEKAKPINIRLGNEGTNTLTLKPTITGDIQGCTFSEEALQLNGGEERTITLENCQCPTDEDTIKSTLTIEGGEDCSTSRPVVINSGYIQDFLMKAGVIATAFVILVVGIILLLR